MAKKRKPTIEVASYFSPENGNGGVDNGARKVLGEKKPAYVRRPPS